MELYYKGKTNIPGIQILKFLAALAVVHIHTTDLFHGPWHLVWRLAVPCFFMISGYFLINSRGEFDLAKIRRHLIKMVKLTFWASAITIMVKWSLDWYIQQWKPGIFPRVLDPMASPVFWKRLFLIGDAAGAPLWYLMAYTQILAILWLAVRWRAMRFIYIIAAVSIPLMIWLQHHFSTGIETNARYFGLRAYLFTRPLMALPCVLTGVLIRRYESRIRRFVNKLTCWLLPAAAAGLCIVEYNILTANGWFLHIDMPVTTLPAAVMVLIFFLAIPNWRILSPLSRAGQIFSLPIYLIHQLIIQLIPLMIYFVVLNRLPRIPKEYYAIYAIIVSMVLTMVWIIVRYIVTTLAGWLRSAAVAKA